MYFDNNTSATTNTTTSVQQQKQDRPFVYIQYPNNTNQHYRHKSTHNNNDSHPHPQLQHQQQKVMDNSSPSSSSSSTSSSLSSVIANQSKCDQNNKKQDKTQNEPPKKKKRQHIGYACDKCRERRVGCDRGRPICGQCKDRYQCQYSNHALRLDNVSMRQRLDELENQVGWLTSFVTHLEQDYRSTVPRIQPHVQPHVAQPSPLLIVNAPQPNPMVVAPRLAHQDGPSVYDWAISTGWPVVENVDGMKSIFTTIKNFEDLSEALRSTVETIYSTNGLPIYRQPGSYHQFNHIPHIDLSKKLGKGQWKSQQRQHSITSLEDTGKKEHTFTLFESLNRYSKSTGGKTNSEPLGSSADRYLETDVMSRLIHQHHKCGFPTLVSPSRFESHFRQGQLKPLVLSSVFSHSVPHCCIYHPHLTQIQDFRELGNKFYNHSHDLLGIDEPANLSNIHQRALLITYDLDLGRVRRAFLHIGIAIRMCFMLNLHRAEGYTSCKSAFEREQSKRIFWTVWFYDNMVSHLFHDQLSTIKLNQISIDLPTPLPDFTRIELDQTTFAVSLIQIRKIAASISEESRTMKPRALVDRFREKLIRYYRSLLTHLQFSRLNLIEFPPDTSIWGRRTYFCILLDYCQCWISLYRALLPSANHQGENPLTKNENEAILHTSQAALAILQLFQNWFRCSVQSEDGFDCFFRPYLYHFMSAKNIFSSNVSQYGRSPALVFVSRACVMLLLQLYQTTPTRNSFDESQLEKDLLQFLNLYQIESHEVAYQSMIDEALRDDPSADNGWSIFAQYSKQHTSGEKEDYLNVNGSMDDLQSRCSSNSSVISDQCTAELDLDYF